MLVVDIILVIKAYFCPSKDEKEEQQSKNGNGSNSQNSSGPNQVLPKQKDENLLEIANQSEIEGFVAEQPKQQQHPGMDLQPQPGQPHPIPYAAQPIYQQPQQQQQQQNGEESNYQDQWNAMHGIQEPQAANSQTSYQNQWNQMHANQPNQQTNQSYDQQWQQMHQ